MSKFLVWALGFCILAVLVAAGMRADRPAHRWPSVRYDGELLDPKTLKVVASDLESVGAIAWLGPSLLVSYESRHELRLFDPRQGRFDKLRASLEAYADALVPGESTGPMCVVPFADPARGARVLLCDPVGRRLAEIGTAESARDIETLVSVRDEARLNGPYDAVDAAGLGIYFTDPLREQDAPATGTPRVSAIYRFDRSRRKLQRLSTQLSHPAGVAFRSGSNGGTLYVANADPQRSYWGVFRVAADGSLDEGNIFADATSLVGSWPGDVGPITLDSEGNLIAAAPGGIHVYAQNGRLRQVLQTSEAVTALLWSADQLHFVCGSHLYMISSSAGQRSATSN